MVVSLSPEIIQVRRFLVHEAGKRQRAPLVEFRLTSHSVQFQRLLDVEERYPHSGSGSVRKDMNDNISDLWITSLVENDEADLRCILERFTATSSQNTVLRNKVHSLPAMPSVPQDLCRKDKQ